MNPVEVDQAARRDPQFRAEGARYDDRPSYEELVRDLPEPERSQETGKRWQRRH